MVKEHTKEKKKLAFKTIQWFVYLIILSWAFLMISTSELIKEELDFYNNEEKLIIAKLINPRKG